MATKKSLDEKLEEEHKRIMEQFSEEVPRSVTLEFNSWMYYRELMGSINLYELPDQTFSKGIFRNGIKEFVDGKTFIDLGCGLPDNVRKNVILKIKKLGARRYIGVDRYTLDGRNYLSWQGLSTEDIHVEFRYGLPIAFVKDDILSFLSKMQYSDGTVFLLSGLEPANIIDIGMGRHEQAEMKERVAKKYFDAVALELGRIAVRGDVVLTVDSRATSAMDLKEMGFREGMRTIAKSYFRKEANSQYLSPFDDVEWIKEGNFTLRKRTISKDSVKYRRSNINEEKTVFYFSPGHRVPGGEFGPELTPNVAYICIDYPINGPELKREVISSLTKSERKLLGTALGSKASIAKWFYNKLTPEIKETVEFYNCPNQGYTGLQEDLVEEVHLYNVFGDSNIREPERFLDEALRIVCGGGDVYVGQTVALDHYSLKKFLQLPQVQKNDSEILAHVQTDHATSQESALINSLIGIHHIDNIDNGSYIVRVRKI